MATYDTGATLPQRTIVRRAALAALAPLLRPTGYLVAVVPFGSVVRSYTDEVGIRLLYECLNGRTPAIAVAVGDRVSQARGVGGYTFSAELEVILYHVSQHGRDLVTGRLEADVVAAASSTADPGLDQQIEQAEELLVGVNPDAALHLSQFRPVRDGELAALDEVTIYEQRFSITCSREIRRARNVTATIDSLRAGYRPSEYPGAPADPLLVALSTIEED